MNNKKTINKKVVRGFSLVFGYLGIFLILAGIITLIPLILLCFYPNESECWYLFAIPGLSYILIGLFLYLFLLHDKPRAHFARYESAQLLILVWFMAVLAGAFPFYLGYCFGYMNMDFSESIFESASAYSATGLTCFKDYVDSPNAFSPHVFCFHRSLMQFIGGVGLVLLLESMLGASSTSLYQSEGHSDKLLPSMAKSARLLFGIYSGYTLVGTLALWIAGMDPFDALNHSMCALSGGGMSTHANNVAYFSSSQGNGVLPASPLAIEIILMFLVTLSGISFLLHTFLLTGKWKKFFKDDEIRFSLFCIILASTLMVFSGAHDLALLNHNGLWDNFGTSARESIFFVVGAATTSGFSNVSLQEMLNLGKPLLWTCTVLMIVGGGAGSSGGGIKQYRIFVCLKDLWYNLKYHFSPSHQINPRTTYRYGKLQPLSDETVKEAHNYSLLFLLVFGLSVLVLTFLPEFDAEEAAFDVASGMSNTGLSATDFVLYGQAHPLEYPIVLWTLSVGMILGRLEIMPLIFAGRNIKEEIVYQKHMKRLAKERSEEKDDFDDDDL